MQLVLEKRAERSNTIALVSPLIAIGLTLVTMSILFAILGKNPISALGVYFIDPLDRQLFAAGDRGEGDAAGDDRDRPVALLSRQCLEHRRRRPVPDRRRRRQLARGEDAGHRRRPLGIAGDAGAGALRRRALCADPGDLQGAVRRQRNPHQPDAGLCRRSPARLSRARSLARSARVSISRPPPSSIRSRPCRC